jgi:thiol-disulfide isomerase/thioredoxin
LETNHLDKADMKLPTTVAAGLIAVGLAANCALFAASEAPPWSKPAPAASLASLLQGATGWLNTPAAPTPESLRGKVVLVEFWTYSCINCLRTLPYVRAWEQKYRANGLVVIGVHTPEFGFEQQMANVQRAAQQLHIDYPVALDSQRTIWRAFGNRAWPALYFVDAHGRVRHQQDGEGGYDEAERLIQQLLKESGAANVPAGLVAPQGEGTQMAAAAVEPGSEETYVGRARASGFVAKDAAALRTNEWTLAGAWQSQDEFAQLARPGGRIAYRFRARDLHMVLGSADGRPVRFRVRIDGQAPGGDHGSDVDAEGRGQVDAQRLYQLVRQRSGSAERTFEIEFLDPGVRAYAFTFG